MRITAHSVMDRRRSSFTALRFHQGGSSRTDSGLLVENRLVFGRNEVKNLGGRDIDRS